MSAEEAVVTREMLAEFGRMSDETNRIRAKKELYRRYKKIQTRRHNYGVTAESQAVHDWNAALWERLKMIIREQMIADKAEEKEWAEIAGNPYAYLLPDWDVKAGRPRQ